jgi:hypothetical protein
MQVVSESFTVVTMSSGCFWRSEVTSCVSRSATLADVRSAKSLKSFCGSLPRVPSVSMKVKSFAEAMMCDENVLQCFGKLELSGQQMRARWRVL